MPRMKSLPEPSKPFGDLAKTDHQLQNVDKSIVDSQVEVDVRDRFTFLNFVVVLSIPLVGGIILLVIIYLANPLAISWLASSESPAYFTNSLWNIPKSIKQIQSELLRSQLKLGENYNLKTGEIIYTVLETETQNIREIRFYQAVWDRGEEKLLLVSTSTVSGVDEYFVRLPMLKYATYAMPERLRPNRNRLPVKKLSILDNAPDKFGDQKGGVWFTTSASIDGIAYGQIYYFATDKRSQLFELDAWTSATGELPKWRSVLASNPNSLQLLVNQSQDFEPMFLIFLPEEVIVNSIRKIQLRQITLNEAKDQPKTYQDALVMASVGLWSPALAKFNLMVENLKSQGKTLSPFLQEQYDMIALHARTTSDRAQQPNSNLGDKALINIIDGRWKEALAIANDPAYKGDKIVEMLAKYHPHIWQRVMTMLTFTGASEIKLWGGLVVLHRDGLRRAEHWLREQKVDTKEYNQLLQRLDLAPLSLNPKQLLGTVTYIGKGNAGSEWFLPPPKLEAGQVWYEVSVDLIKDGDKWSNEPFSELSNRSSILLWRVLGFSLNNNLGVLLYDAEGDSQASTLTAQSLWVSDDGRLKVLASGDATLAPLLRKSIIPPLVTNGGSFSSSKGVPVDWQILSAKAIERIIRTMYSELQRYGQVTMSIEDFSVLLQQQWKLLEINIDGVGKPEYILSLDRTQINLGDRRYPLKVVFSSEGSLLFSDLNGERIWMDLLSSSEEGQILTLRNGRYEVWKFR